MTALEIQQHLRRAALDSMTWQQAVEFIAAHICRAARSPNQRTTGNTPRDWYAVRLKPRK